jgi:hypothetical protein
MLLRQVHGMSSGIATSEEALKRQTVIAELMGFFRSLLCFFSFSEGRKCGTFVVVGNR